MASKWDGIKSRKILAMLREVLGDDRAFSQVDVVKVIRAMLDDGVLTPSHINDLRIIADNSSTMPPRPMAMLRYLIAQEPQINGAAGQFQLTTLRQTYAADLVCAFLRQRMGRAAFPGLDRDQVGIDLLLRIGNPEIVNQKSANFCGPIGFVYSLAADSPGAYAKYVTDLYDKGKAKIDDTVIEPSEGCRSYSPPTSSIGPADWIAAASLRDSQNWVFDVDDIKDGTSTIDDVEAWFKMAGYTDVKSEKNLFFSLKSGDIDDLNRYFREGRRVVLRINSNMLYSSRQDKSSRKGNHIVVLRSPIARTGQGVELAIYTWGMGKFAIPQGGPLSENDFLENLYGYVAGKPY